MAQITLEWDQRLLVPLSKDRISRATAKALSKAGGDAIRAIRVDASRYIRAHKRIKVARVNKSLVLRFPKGSTSIDDLQWRMDVSGKPIPVADYPWRQTKRGVSVAINKAKRTLIPHAFSLTLSNGHTGIFLRKGKERNPIRQLLTTRVNDPFADTGMIPGVFDRGRVVFAASFARLLPLELAKLK